MSSLLVGSSRGCAACKSTAISSEIYFRVSQSVLKECWTGGKSSMMVVQIVSHGVDILGKGVRQAAKVDGSLLR
jgi:hypothetical protein